MVPDSPAVGEKDTNPMGLAWITTACAEKPRDRDEAATRRPKAVKRYFIGAIPLKIANDCCNRSTL
jgi:hypothetical protein